MFAAAATCSPGSSRCPCSRNARAEIRRLLAVRERAGAQAIEPRAVDIHRLHVELVGLPSSCLLGRLTSSRQRASTSATRCQAPRAGSDRSSDRPDAANRTASAAPAAPDRCWRSSSTAAASAAIRLAAMGVCAFARCVPFCGASAAGRCSAGGVCSGSTASAFAESAAGGASLAVSCGVSCGAACAAFCDRRRCLRHRDSADLSIRALLARRHAQVPALRRRIDGRDHRIRLVDLDGLDRLATLRRADRPPGRRLRRRPARSWPARSRRPRSGRSDSGACAAAAPARRPSRHSAARLGRIQRHARRRRRAAPADPGRSPDAASPRPGCRRPAPPAPGRRRRRRFGRRSRRAASRSVLGRPLGLRRWPTSEPSGATLAVEALDRPVALLIRNLAPARSSCGCARHSSSAELHRLQVRRASQFPDRSSRPARRRTRRATPPPRASCLMMTSQGRRVARGRFVPTRHRISHDGAPRLLLSKSRRASPDTPRPKTRKPAQTGGHLLSLFGATLAHFFHRCHTQYVEAGGQCVAPTAQTIAILACVSGEIAFLHESQAPDPRCPRGNGRGRPRRDRTDRTRRDAARSASAACSTRRGHSAQLAGDARAGEGCLSQPTEIRLGAGPPSATVLSPNSSRPRGAAPSCTRAWAYCTYQTGFSLACFCASTKSKSSGASFLRVSMTKRVTSGADLVQHVAQRDEGLPARLRHLEGLRRP